MKKVLVVFLAVAMLFAFSAAALAAPSDLVGEPTDVQDAFNKFIAYGFIEGYEDGTVKPYNEITRAEFAKIICMLTGNGSMGESLKGTASQFKDVAAGEWYTGWVNGAAAVGYFVGYTDGTFKPSNKVTDGEVITVLLRIAGYNDNLAGSWPYNYVVKGNSLGIVEEAINFSAAANSSRANVVLMANALLDKDVPMVAFSKDTESFVNVKDGNDKVQTVANYYKAIGNTNEYVITGWAVNAKNQLTVTARLNATGATAKTLVFADDYQIADGLSLYDLEGLTAKITLNKDDKIVFVDPLDTVIISLNYSISDGSPADGSRDTITINGTKYNNGLGTTIKAAMPNRSGTAGGNRAFRFIINEDLQLISATPVAWEGEADTANGDAYGVVKSISSAGVITVNTGLRRGGTFARSTDLNNKELVVFVDGKLATIEDIQENYFVVQRKGENGVDYIYYATSPATVSVTSITGSSGGQVASFVAGGRTYYSPFYNVVNPTTSNPNPVNPTSVAGGYVMVKTAGDSTYTALTSTTFNDSGLKGVEALAIRANDGSIIALSYGEVTGSSSTVYGVVTGATMYTENTIVSGTVVSTPLGYSKITVVNAAGQTVSYDIKDDGTKIDYFFTSTGAFQTLTMGTGVILTLNSSGLVTNVRSMADATASGSVALNSGKTSVQIGTQWYAINSNTVYMVVSMDNNKVDKVEIKSLSSISSGDRIKATTIDARISNGIVTHMILGGATSSDSKYGVIRDLYYNGNQIRLYDGSVYDKASGFNSAQYDVVRYTVSNDEITIEEVLLTRAQVQAGSLSTDTVINANASVINVVAKSYLIDDDTLVIVFADGAYSNNTYDYNDIYTDDEVIVVRALDDDGVTLTDTAAIIIIIR